MHILSAQVSAAAKEIGLVISRLLLLFDRMRSTATSSALMVRKIRAILRFSLPEKADRHRLAILRGTGVFLCQS